MCALWTVTWSRLDWHFFSSSPLATWSGYLWALVPLIRKYLAKFRIQYSRVQKRSRVMITISRVLFSHNTMQFKSRKELLLPSYPMQKRKTTLLNNRRWNFAKIGEHKRIADYNLNNPPYSLLIRIHHPPPTHPPPQFRNYPAKKSSQ